jgi:hypothetical protein
MWAVDFQFNDTTVGRYAAIPARAIVAVCDVQRGRRRWIIRRRALSEPCDGPGGTLKNALLQ